MKSTQMLLPELLPLLLPLVLLPFFEKIDEIRMLACIKNSMQNGRFGMPKFKKIVKKNGSKNHIFFVCVFLSILERFGKGVGRVLGELWEALGVSWATFKPLFSRPFCQEGPRGSKRRPRGLLGSIWKGLERFWERFGRRK